VILLISIQFGGTVADTSLFLEVDCVRLGTQSSRKVVVLRESEAHALMVQECTIAPGKWSGGEGPCGRTQLYN